MNFNKTDELQMTYLGLLQTNKGLAFSVDGKETPVYDFKKSIESIVGFVTQFSYNPVIAKIEVLDPKEYFVMSLTLPIAPAFLDIYDSAEIQKIASPEYLQAMKQKARTFKNGETKELIESRAAEYINYIQHELAGAYINCMLSGKESLAKCIQKLPIMRDFDLSTFNFSGAGKNIYKTPQFLKYKTEINGKSQTRQYYMGLQEIANETEKDNAFWDNVSKRDFAYITLDESMNQTLSTLEQKYGEIDFLNTNVSSNHIETPAQKS